MNEESKPPLAAAKRSAAGCALRHCPPPKRAPAIPGESTVDPYSPGSMNSVNRHLHEVLAEAEPVYAAA